MESFRQLCGVLGLSSACLLASTAGSAAPAPQAPENPGPVRIDSAIRGQVVQVPGNPNRAEMITLGEDLPGSLLRIPPEHQVRLAGWPVAPEERADVVLTRHEIYAPDARIWKIDKGRRTEVPRSKLAFFWGTAEGDEGTWVLVSVDPDSRQVQGFASQSGKVHHLRPWKEAGGKAAAPQELVIAQADFFFEEAGGKPKWDCGQGVRQASLAFLESAQEAATAPTSPPVEPIFAPAITSLHTATLAVDTDNEFMLQKFNNNSTAATSYIANLIASMNIMYERDLKIRLLQGTTFLRPSTTADPYSATTSTSTGLSELMTEWSRSTYTSIPRALTMMLSGRSPSAYSAAGIARLSALCSRSGGYSFSQVFKFAADTSTYDSSLVGHEIGHNFGSPHTHCYSPPIDTCYSGECYSGATSCPATTVINGVSARGTVMSYCHLLGGCSAAEVFHQRTIDLLNPVIESSVNTCIFPLNTGPQPPTVSAVIPNSGTTAGGTAVTITGTNFRAGAGVTFGGTAATSVVVVNSTTITAVTPARSTGAVSVAVNNSDGTSATRSNGYFYAPPSAALGFHTLTPCRLVDTRNANGPRGGPALSANQQRTFTATGACGIPSAAKALSVNVTIVNPAGSGQLAFYPGNAFPLGTSNINFRSGQIRANNATLMLSTNGTGTFGAENGSSGTTHLIVDVNGYYQ